MNHPSAKPPAIVLLSGGLDSATCLAIARRDGYAAHALAFDYGQRHRVELACAKRVADHLGAASFRTVVLGLREIGGSALTADIAVPDAGSSSPSAIPVTYVPARNLTFLSIAAGLAEVVGAQAVYIGVNAVDYSGYPDCRRPFIDAFEHAAALGTKSGVEGQRLKVLTPLVSLAKADIIRLGVELGVDFALTTSCYNPTPAGLSCGHCDSCDLRRRGFAQANVPDPTHYATRDPA
ncbi:MAG: 7-cyano-7-deazaguanine synthase QueC [Planctomycetota bacterium]